MSGYLAGRVWRSALDPVLKPLAACLADFGNDDGSGIYPSNEYLQWLLGYSESTVHRHMAALRELGILVVVENESGGRGKIPVYKLIVSALPGRLSWDQIKGRIMTPFGDKRVSPVQEKGVTGETKGCQTTPRNKEEPSVEPSVEGSAPGFEPLQYAAKLIEDTQLAGYPMVDSFAMRRAIAGAITALIKSGQLPDAAYRFLQGVTLDHLERGERVDKFWFEDTKWRSNGNGRAHTTAQQERTQRGREAILTGTHRYLSNRDRTDERKRPGGG